jgi:putative acetyltransferase
MIIAEYSETNLEEITDLFHRTVHAIDPSIYSEKEKEAWAPAPPDYLVWDQRLSCVKTYMACDNGKIIGFTSIGSPGYIDYFFVDPDYQGKGIGKLLYYHLERFSQDTHTKKLIVEASKVARPFFERMGFILISENQVIVNGQTLTNYTMKKER